MQDVRRSHHKSASGFGDLDLRISPGTSWAVPSARLACQRFGRPTLAKQIRWSHARRCVTLAHGGRMDLRYRFDAERLPEQLDHWPGRHRGALARIAHRQHAETAVCSHAAALDWSRSRVPICPSSSMTIDRIRTKGELAALRVGQEFGQCEAALLVGMPVSARARVCFQPEAVP